MGLKPSSEPDWFFVDNDLVERLRGTPGFKSERGRLKVHRSMLPLVSDVPDVARILDRGYDPERRTRMDAHTEPLGFKLRPHQHAGVEYISERRSVLLADEPRVGKTLQSVMSHDPKRGKMIVFCPMMVRDVWRGWIERAFPGEQINYLKGRSYDSKLLDAPFIIGHYDILKGWNIAQKVGTLVFDEIHVLGRNNHRTISANFVAQRAEKVLGLSGTPLWNKPIGLFALLNVLAQGAWGDYWAFGDRYAAPEPTAFGRKYTGTSNELELMTRLKEVMLHRKHRDVSTDLPSISRDILIADISPEQLYEIELAAEALRTAGSEATVIGAMARYRKVIGSVKLPTSIEAAKMFLDKEEPVVIWAWHKDVARAIHRELKKKKYDSFIVTGDPKDGSIKKRGETLDAWRKTRGALVITIVVGQVGIDLSHARSCIFAEMDFTPALIAQAEMRTYSPLRSMSASYVIADHRSDRQMIAALESKLTNSDKIGVPAAEAAIDILKSAFDAPIPEGDLDRLMRDLMQQAYIEG